MNKYENVIIVVPTLDEKQQKQIIDKYIDLINQSGKVESVENLGRRRLAYEIRKNKEGIYITFNFESEHEFIAELERQYRIDDNVIKFIVVRRED